jgi:NAD(P)-dependent dehydrogenase (short-subunit alcohol dehydrogenase family)
MDTLELGLKGKIAIVTGGSEGMGRAAAERFARSGARVTMCARRKDVLERAADEIRKATGAEVLPLSADVSSPAGCQAVVAATVGQFGGVDILLNNAGTSSAAPLKGGDDAWQATSTADGRHSHVPARHPHMKQRGAGASSTSPPWAARRPGPRACPPACRGPRGSTSPSRWPTSTRPIASS